VGGKLHAPAALPPRKRPDTHCVGGWVGPRAGLDGCGKSRPPTGIRSPDRPARSDPYTDYSIPGHIECVDELLNVGTQLLKLSVSHFIRSQRELSPPLKPSMV